MGRSVDLEYGTRDSGDCRGCSYLLNILMMPESFLMMDEQIAQLRAQDQCGYCSRKPDSVKVYAPAERCTSKWVKDEQTQQWKLASSYDEPLEDKFKPTGQSQLRTVTINGETFLDRTIPENALRRLDEFVSQIVFNTR